LWRSLTYIVFALLQEQEQFSFLKKPHAPVSDDLEDFASVDAVEGILFHRPLFSLFTSHNFIFHEMQQMVYLKSYGSYILTRPQKIDGRWVSIK